MVVREMSILKWAITLDNRVRRRPAALRTTIYFQRQTNKRNHMTDIIYVVVSIVSGGILILFAWSCSKI